MIVYMRITLDFLVSRGINPSAEPDQEVIQKKIRDDFYLVVKDKVE